MKATYVLPLLLVLALNGCSSSYVIRLSNGRQLTTPTKPKLRNGAYQWKDAKGNLNSIPQGRVVEIMPASMAEREKSRFK